MVRGVFGALRRIVTSRMLVVLALIAISAVSVLVGTQLQHDAAAPSAAERERPDGSLSADPQPLSLDDVRATANGSASEAVMYLWYWAQWGGLPNVLAVYSPAVVARLGAEDMAGAYSLQRASLLAARPEIVSEVTGPGGTMVAVRALRRNTKPQELSYTLRRIRGEWRIVFDTQLESGLAAWVQFRSTPDPESGDAPPSARRAGIAAARAYRAVGLGVPQSR
jgi:hypothetical protein